MVKKTSSRLGSRSDSLLTPIPAASSLRTTSANALSPSPPTGTPTTSRREVSAPCPDTAFRIAATSMSRAGSRGRTTIVRPPAIRFSSAGVPDAMTAPRVDHGDLVGEGVGLLQVLRGQQDRAAVAGHRPDQPPRLLPPAGVEARRG